MYGQSLFKTMDKLEQLEQLLAGAKVDAAKFYEKGNNAAGTRLRKAMLEIRSLANESRKDVSAVKNSK